MSFILYVQGPEYGCNKSGKSWRKKNQKKISRKTNQSSLDLWRDCEDDGAAQAAARFPRDRLSLSLINAILDV
jgi:hypothetical protein